MNIFERRASTILYNLIQSHPIEGPFLLPANVCPIVPMVFFKSKRSFEFIDIDRDTLCIDHNALIDRCSKPLNRPAGVIYVRSYGAIFDTSDVFKRIRHLSPKALIIDDRCLCPPDFYSSLPHNIDAVLYSTGYAKYVDIGFGGYGIIRKGVNYSRTETQFNPKNLDNLTENFKNIGEQGCFSYQDSDWLETAPPQESWETYQELVNKEYARVTKIKSKINSIYRTELSPDIQFPSVFQSWRFNIQVKEKKAVLDAICRNGLFASGHFSSLAGALLPGNAPCAENVYQQVINLFNDRYFSTKQAIKLTNLLNEMSFLTPGTIFS